ncbi:MAG: hypothetical protein ACRD0U_04945, partial [Acidimicrobiales bacterium]
MAGSDGSLTVSFVQARAGARVKHGLGPGPARGPLTASDRPAGVYGMAPTCALSMAARVEPPSATPNAKAEAIATGIRLLLP